MYCSRDIYKGKHKDEANKSDKSGKTLVTITTGSKDYIDLLILFDTMVRTELVMPLNRIYTTF